ncbi:unnamed protein product [Polarella glacialis]|uniref:Phosphatidic acid phosphatase type 2/haloperoxidase domain-containing protein n=1 Tax=Polarella glacialis TaxID=89957 RepID=A0A813G072_POLGL|nr:unnamed protein product [Polarella glacialis]|mmetsp:Transcript_103644/g.187010  ORF Transcript_103644/g.187010 Transcript_103644/m.187010 type:complete len:249 (-) Transcript_103644:91-837(-)
MVNSAEVAAALLELVTGADGCIPAWAVKDQPCPHGQVLGLFSGNFTWPSTGITWITYVAAFYSFLPFVLLVSIVLGAIWTQGVRQLLALVFWQLGQAIGAVLKSTFREPRPEGTCFKSCGMPSSHSLAATSFFVWIALEVSNSQIMESKQKMLLLAAAGLGLLPITWSRVELIDHSPSQVAAGAAIGALFALLWYSLLCQRVTIWALKLMKARFPCLKLDYPLDGISDEPPWQVQNPAYGAAAPPSQK